MPPKRRGPLQTVQRSSDDIKKQVDSLMLEVREFKARSAESRAMAEASERCKHLQKLVEDTMVALKKLTKADEPAPVGSYEQRKQDEEDRLKTMQGQLQALSLAVAPAPKPGTSRNADKPSSSQTEEEDDAEEGSEEEEGEEEEEEDDEEVENGAETFIAISAFRGEQKDDLSVQQGELLRVLSKNADGWWLAQDSRGNKGLVPKTYLKAHVYVEEEDDTEDSETEEESEEEEEEEEEEDEVSKTKQSSQKSSWNAVRKEVLEMNATDVLAAMGAIPAGFRPSTLSSLLSGGHTYTGSYYLQPELSQSQLAFKDLFWDPDTGTVRHRPSRTSLTLTLWSCRMIPTPGVGVQVLSRHVRICMFDGAKVLSNIHMVRACYNPKNPKTWTFSPRMVGILPSLMDGDCFIRSDALSPDLGVLFELGVTYIRNSTGERGDLSCGWAFLRLCDVSGVPVPHRTYELPVHGGTPYEPGVDVDPTVPRRATGGVLQQMMVSRKQPKLIVKLKSPDAKTRANLNLLPDTLVGSSCSIRLLALYRQLLADALLRDRLTMQNADLICSPVLATFPQVLQQTDLLDALRIAWAERESRLKRSQKQDVRLLTGLFVEVYLETVVPLLHSSALPPPCWADEERESQRAAVLFAPRPSPSQHAVSALLSADHAQEAFDIAQLAYDFLSPARALPTHRLTPPTS